MRRGKSSFPFVRRHADRAAFVAFATTRHHSSVLLSVRTVPVLAPLSIILDSDESWHSHTHQTQDKLLHAKTIFPSSGSKAGHSCSSLAQKPHTCALGPLKHERASAKRQRRAEDDHDTPAGPRSDRDIINGHRDSHTREDRRKGPREDRHESDGRRDARVKEEPHRDEESRRHRERHNDDRHRHDRSRRDDSREAETRAVDKDRGRGERFRDGRQHDDRARPSHM
ncbi:hypothetical protein MRB53_038693 [Persea americana]|nr:hypothetical protein MRB53_038693 [Persea americana]